MLINKMMKTSQNVLQAVTTQDKPKMCAFIATIPPNVRPGQQFAAILNGEKRVFVCPPGTGSGSKVQVLVPAPPPVAVRTSTFPREGENKSGDDDDLKAQYFDMLEKFNQETKLKFPERMHRWIDIAERKSKFSFTSPRVSKKL